MRSKLNLLTALLLILLLAFFGFGSALRAQRAAQQAERERLDAVNRQQKHEAKLALLPRLSSYPELRREPKGSMGQGPMPCLEATSSIPGGTIPAGGASSASAISEPTLTGPSAIIRFAMGDKSFSLPEAPMGVLVQVAWKQANRATTDYLVKLTCDGSEIGANKATGSVLPASLAYTSYGEATDNWDYTLTSTIVNDPSFGVVIQIHQGDDPMAIVSQIQGVQVTVYGASHEPSGVIDGPFKSRKASSGLPCTLVTDRQD